MMLRNLTITMSVAVGLLTASGGFAADSATELAKQTQNPVAKLISVPFKLINDFNTGPDDKTSYTFEIKPVIPISLNDEWNIIHRFIIPIRSSPGIDGTSIARENGMGDTTYQMFFPQRNLPTVALFGAQDLSLNFPLIAMTS